LGFGLWALGSGLWALGSGLWGLYGSGASRGQCRDKLQGQEPKAKSRVRKVPMLRAIVLDFDGVIADTEPLHLRAFQDVLEEVGVALSADDYYARYVGLDDWGLARTLAEDWPQLSGQASQLRAIVARKWARYETFISAAPVLFEGVHPLLREWSLHVPLAIASGARRREIEIILGGVDLLPCFTSIVTTDEVARGKPAPDVYLLALERINQAAGLGRQAHERPAPSSAFHLRPAREISAADVVAIEDSRWGIDAARAAGMRTVAVAGTGRTSATPANAELVVESITGLDLQTLIRLASR
jgi:beta-phosphoglucomutase